MKKKSIILSLAMTLVVGVGATAYAATTTETNESKGYKYGSCVGNTTNRRGYDILASLLNSKGVTDDEIYSAKTLGKSLYDLAVEKGITDEEIKDYMVNEKIKNIDELVANGDLTAEEGEETKTAITENSANRTVGEGNGKKYSMNSKNSDRMGINQRGNCRGN